MSDLRPEGIPVMIDGVERKILFTLNAVDSIQDRLGMSIDEAIDNLTVPRKANEVFKVMVSSLLNDEVERLDFKKQPHDLKKYTEKEAGWLITETNKYEMLGSILKAYGISLPEPEEEEDEAPNGQSVQQENH